MDPRVSKTGSVLAIGRRWEGRDGESVPSRRGFLRVVVRSNAGNGCRSAHGGRYWPVGRRAGGLARVRDFAAIPYGRGVGSVARELSEVGVVGLGTMGAGITEVLARAGLSVTAVEVTDEALARGRAHLAHSTDRAIKRGKLDEAERDAIFERIRFS